jgi:hypothetical protein
VTGREREVLLGWWERLGKLGRDIDLGCGEGKRKRERKGRAGLKKGRKRGGKG